MKRDLDKLNLQSAFGPEPEACHAALMAAARSVKEERRPARSLRTLAVAALMLLCMMAAAFAASRAGLLDWLWQDMGVRTPASASKVLAATRQETYTVGPLAMTVTETLADGHLAYLTVNAAGTDGAALVYEGSGDLFDPVGTTLAKALNHPDILAETTLVQAARKSGLPLYSVMAWLQLEEGVGEGTEMMDALRQEDGSLLLIDMLLTDPARVGDSLNASIYLRVKQIDPVTMEPMEKAWQTVEQRTLTINGVTQQRNYLPQDNAALNDGLTITGVMAEQTCAGVYVTIAMDTRKDMTCEELWNSGLAALSLLDASGNDLPDGISLTSDLLCADGSPLPEDGPVGQVQFQMMLGVDALPESMTIAMPHGNTVTVR